MLLALLVASMGAHYLQSGIQAREQIAQLVRHLSDHAILCSVRSPRVFKLPLQRNDLLLNVGAISQDLAEPEHLTGRSSQCDERARSPETGAIGPQMPAIVLRDCIGVGNRNLQFGQPGSLIDRCENLCERHADCLLTWHCEDALRTFAPPGDSPLGIEQEDRVLERGVHQQT